MKKKILLLMLVLCVLSMHSGAYAANYTGVRVLGIEESADAFSDGWDILVLLANGESAIYTCAEDLFINGEGYDGEQDLPELIPIGTLADISVVNDEITELNFEAAADAYIFDFYSSTNNLFFDIYAINTTSAAKSGHLCVALYSGGALNGVVYKAFSLDGTDYTAIQAELKNAAAGDIVKLFMWNDSLKNYIPVMKYTLEYADSQYELVKN